MNPTPSSVVTPLSPSGHFQASDPPGSAGSSDAFASASWYGQSFRPPFWFRPACLEHPLLAEGERRARFYWRNGKCLSLAHPEGIQRFRCRSCLKQFNRCAFDLEYREKAKTFGLNAKILKLQDADISHRELGRLIHRNESFVRARLKKCAKLGLLLHAHWSGSRTLSEPIVYDGLENFAGSQYDPNQIQQAIGKDSLFIYDFNFIPLNRKGRISPRQRGILRAIEQEKGRYPKRAIRTASAEIFGRLIDRADPLKKLHLFMDQHFQYKRALDRDLPKSLRARVEVTTISSKDSRTFQNQLFAVNHADLLIRHRCAAFTRETISFSKTHQAMIEKYILFLLAKNYVRPQFVKKHRRREKAHLHTPAMEAGVMGKPLSHGELFQLRIWPTQVKLHREWQAFYDEVPTYPRVRQAAA